MEGLRLVASSIALASVRDSRWSAAFAAFVAVVSNKPSSSTRARPARDNRIFIQSLRGYAQAQPIRHGNGYKMFLAGGLNRRSAQRRTQIEGRVSSERDLAIEGRNRMIGRQ